MIDTAIKYALPYLDVTAITTASTIVYYLIDEAKRIWDLSAYKRYIPPAASVLGALLCLLAYEMGLHPEPAGRAVANGVIAGVLAGGWHGMRRTYRSGNNAVQAPKD